MTVEIPVKQEQESVEESSETWIPVKGSPFVLLDEEARDSDLYRPTFDNMATQILNVPVYAAFTDEQLRRAWETSGFQEAWTRNREQLALRVFIVGYQRREYDRWYAGEASVALETELQPVVSFISTLTDPGAAWLAIDAYSTSVLTAIYDSGEQLPKQDDMLAKWSIFRELTKQAAGDTAFVDQTLEDLRE